MEQAIAYHQEGAKLFQEGKAEEAIPLLNQSLEICKQNEQKPCAANNLNVLGLANGLLGKDEEALDFFRQALVANQELGNNVAVAAILNSMGKIFSDQGKYDEAFEHLNKSFEISLELKNRFGLATVCYNIGKVYDHLQNYDMSLQFYNKSLELFATLGEKERARMLLESIRIAERERGNSLVSQRNEKVAETEPTLDVGKPDINASASEEEEPATTAPELESGKKTENIGAIEVKKKFLNLYETHSATSPVLTKVLAVGMHPILELFQEESSKESFYKIKLDSGTTGWISEMENERID